MPQSGVGGKWRNGERSRGVRTYEHLRILRVETGLVPASRSLLVIEEVFDALGDLFGGEACEVAK